MKSVRQRTGDTVDYRFFEPWHLFLPREAGHVVSAFGGGGKTALLSAMAAVFRGEGVPAAVTTTTRSEPLDWPGLEPLELAELTRGPAHPAGDGRTIPFVRDGLHGDGKWRGLAPEAADGLEAQLPGRVLLVEADGSAGLPVKLHEDGEPVWPARTSLAVAVMGLAAVGRPAAEVLHRHGRRTAPWGELAPGVTWDWELMFRLLAGPGGYLARVPEGVPPLLVLTQLAGLADSLGLFAFVGRVMAETAVPIVVFGELEADEPRLLAACRAEPEGEP